MRLNPFAKQRRWRCERALDFHESCQVCPETRCHRAMIKDRTSDLFVIENDDTAIVKIFFVVKVRRYKDVIAVVPGIRTFVHIILFVYAPLETRERAAKFYRRIASFFSGPKTPLKNREKQGGKRSPIPSMDTG